MISMQKLKIFDDVVYNHSKDIKALSYKLNKHVDRGWEYRSAVESFSSMLKALGSICSNTRKTQSKTHT